MPEKQTISDTAPNIEVRSPETQEIMGYIPHWIIRAGITIIGAILAAILVSAWFIEFPETVKIPVRLLATHPAIVIRAPGAGALVTLCVSNGQPVKADECLGGIGSVAEFASVDRLKRQLQALELRIGFTGQTNLVHSSQTNALSQAEELVDELEQSERVAGEGREQADASISALRLKRLEALAQAGNLIACWDNRHLLVSPLPGRVHFLPDVTCSTGTPFSASDPVLEVIPDDPGTVFGVLVVPVQIAGQLRPGQNVTIALTDYPAPQYGFLRGRLEKAPGTTSSDELRVGLSNGLTTDCGKPAAYADSLEGTADIVLRKQRLVYRLLGIR